MTSKRQSSMRSNTNAGPAMVRKSTLIFSVVIALFFGLYLGTLVPKLLSGSQSMPVAQEKVQSSSKITSAETFAADNPKNPNAWIQLGNVYYDAKIPDKAVVAYTKALELQPNNANVLTDRGTMYRHMGKFDLALASYAMASKVDPKHEFSLFNTGIVLYFDLGKKQEAKEVWQKLLQLNPNAKGPDGRSLKDTLKDL